jgi:hypothetical protein
MKGFTLLMVMLACCGSAHAQGTPPGTRGQDWDMKTIDISDNVDVVITGQVSTKNNQSGNTSSIILYIDGVEVKRVGSDRAQNTLTYRYAENGHHKIQVQCSNTRADADICSLTVKQEAVEKFHK